MIFVNGQHHFHVRKRVHEKLEKYPNTNKWKRFLDKLIYFVGILYPLMALPQIFKIWTEKNAIGVSALTWGLHLVCAIFWLTYGIIHNEKPIILTNVLWGIFDFLIIIGTLTYA